MSMISAQIDELRTMAAMLVIKDMSEVAAVVRDAADTIWQLRDDLQRANAENARLRDDLEDQEGYDQMLRDRLRQQTELHVKAADENAKLTKLARWMYQVMDESCAVHYPYKPAPVSMQALMRAEKELQALGIEVDG